MLGEERNATALLHVVINQVCPLCQTESLTVIKRRFRDKVGHRFTKAAIVCINCSTPDKLVYFKARCALKQTAGPSWFEVDSEEFYKVVVCLEGFPPFYFGSLESAQRFMTAYGQF